MHEAEQGTYPPLNTLKRVCDDVWIVDGPMPKLRFPTRMTVIRLPGGDLFIHSPTPLVPELKAEIEAIGGPRWIIGPNRIHYWWIPEWKAAFPQAEVYVAPRILEQAGGRIDFSTFPLDADSGYPWDAEIATLPIKGSFMTEVEFFHRPSRTLVLTDFVANFEPEKLDSFIMRWLTRLAGVQDPDGQMPRDMRLTYVKQKLQLKAAVEKMISWNPERIILAHGRWYPTNGVDELRRAFRWVLA
jgi:Domain of unknown function (DUF4336)